MKDVPLIFSIASPKFKGPEFANGGLVLQLSPPTKLTEGFHSWFCRPSQDLSVFSASSNGN